MSARRPGSFSTDRPRPDRRFDRGSHRRGSVPWPVLIALVFALSQAAGCLSKSATGPGQEGPGPLAYRADDRQAVLERGARDEGKLVWYTSLAGAAIPALATGIEAHYPFLKVEMVRLGAAELEARALQELQAGRTGFDLVETSLPSLGTLRDNGALAPFYSPLAAGLPEASRPVTANGLAIWALSRETYIGAAYNTRLISESEAPSAYEDLLRPTLRGRMAIVGVETGVRTIGNLLTHQGEGFVAQLAQQDVAVQMISAQALLDLVVSGEVPLSPSIFRSHAETAAAKGAPVKWVPLEPVPTNAGGVAIGATAGNPYSALLAVDFLLGPEGQSILVGLGYGSPASPPPFKRWDPERGLGVAEYQQIFDQWEAQLKARFIRR